MYESGRVKRGRRPSLDGRAARATMQPTWSQGRKPLWLITGARVLGACGRGMMHRWLSMRRRGYSGIDT